MMDTRGQKYTKPERVLKCQILDSVSIKVNYNSQIINDDII